ncbi:hypothetical protein [Aquabacterium sp.]|uniref:hypothetical protein n=1 Tax=Aquabacterium sp. TaxID=1872578 RepID=UPI002B5C8CEB|nr:hypothetical protein [Aquabacterium sp.]HSW04967.1 hypothetical protein [Aquabacterium sp.]
MPSKTLPEQTGNSCAAHCTVIAVAELLDVEYLMSKDYAESTLWPSLKFKAEGNLLIDSLAKAENSDPRRIVSEADTRWNAIKASLRCDATQKAAALKYVKSTDMQMGLGALFNMLTGFGTVGTITIEPGIYYNASYLMLKGGTATAAVYEGMHNILVTNHAGQIYYYNPNESKPTWSVTPDWTILEKQNKSSYSYVFTGVCVEMKKK